MMNKIKLKICGMRNLENIREVSALRPDYIGFIFYAKSPRYVGEDFKLPSDFPADIKKVGVFVNASTEEMLKQVQRLRLDYLQLHGNESSQQCEELKKQGVSVIKVFSVDDDFDFNATKPFKHCVDFFLFDTKGKYYGGNARTFNWNILKNDNHQVPFFLSGGISSYNIKDIKELKGMNLYAIDINSGVEATPGMKDIEKIKNIKSEL